LLFSDDELDKLLSSDGTRIDCEMQKSLRRNGWTGK